MNAVIEHGTPLIDDPARVGPVHQLGVDEAQFPLLPPRRPANDHGCSPWLPRQIRTCSTSAMPDDAADGLIVDRRAEAGSANEATSTALARNQAARRRRVLDAALRLADEGGFEAVQMRDVAAAAGVALGTVYRYFDSKERLLLEANGEELEALGRRLLEHPPTGASPADRVVDVLDRACRSLTRRPEATAAMVRAMGSAPPTEADVVRRITLAVDGIITSAMHPGTATERDLAVARILSQVWFSSLIGWVGGVDPASRVAADLEVATRLLLE